jgi:hypothetical protein
MANKSFTSLLQQLNGEAMDIATNDPTCKEMLLQTCRSIVAKLENPVDRVIEVAFSPNVLMAIRVCVDLKVFATLSQADGPITSSQLAKSTGAEEILLIRFMRAVCAISFADEVGMNTYAANAITRAIAMPALEAGFALCYDNAARPKSPMFEAIQYFKQNGYQSPTLATDGPYQRANDCVGVDTFDHWMRDPAETLRFNTYMEIVHSGHPMWFQWYSGLNDLLTTSENEVLLVDIGGGHGHDLNLLAKKVAHVPGRLVLQDLPSVLSEVKIASIDPRIEKQEHDFFTPQPVIGARIYYFHFIIHDWPDSDCIKIMERVRDAMTPGYSRLLLNDAVLPDTKRHVKSMEWPPRFPCYMEFRLTFDT